jgi:predicted enzyme related to lactoylglutathione lyase
MAEAATLQRKDDQAACPTKAAHGSFCWNELMTRDVERAKRFYRDIIGWSFEPAPMADGRSYWCATLDGRPVAGIFPLDAPEFDGVPEGWMAYLAVDDVDRRVEKAVNAGAKLMMPIFDVPGVGRIAILREPGGAGVGWMTPVGDEVAKRRSQ